VSDPSAFYVAVITTYHNAYHNAIDAAIQPT
jgi:hypothetical protein